jgi:hypothetical protein
MINVKKILSLQKDLIIEWHNDRVHNEEELPWKFIEDNIEWNFKLWHEEDIARIKEIDPLRIVLAKRNIDQYNQLRNNSMENIDEWILNDLYARNIQSAEKMHSETPGMMIDRLCIMQLKRYHMAEESTRSNATEEHRARCNDKVIVLDEQIMDLSNCLDRLLNEIYKGDLKFKVYRQFKMYNDPSLNPQLYSRIKG